MDKLTPEQIKGRINAAFQAYRTVAEIYDYAARIRFEVTDDNGRLLCTMPELMVDEAADPRFLEDVLNQVKARVEEKVQSPVGLDDSIRIKGRKTTLRQEHRAGQVKPMRGGNGPVLGKDPFGHWGLVEGQSFSISAADYAFLNGAAKEAT